MHLIVLLKSILTLCLLVHQALCQSVDPTDLLAAGSEQTKGANVVGGGGGQSRNLYTQRHLSPHRKMHFGKRPALADPPTIMEPAQVLDMYRQQQNEAAAAANPFPYILYFELPNGQKLELMPGSQLIAGEQHGVHKQPPPQHHRIEPGFMRLIDAGNENTDSAAEEQQQQQQDQQPQHQPEDAQQQLQQAGMSEEEAISVVGRSMPTENGHLTKAQISSILMGRKITEPPSSLLSLASFVKKTEPRKMTFMHFG